MVSDTRVRAGACLACRGDLELFGPSGDYTYYRCRTCGTLQLWPMPSAADMERAYATTYDSGPQLEKYADPEWWRRVSRPYRECMVRVHKKHRVKGPILECGAGWGMLVEDLRAAGFDARGVEFSHRQAAYAQGRGLPVRQGGLSSCDDLDGQLSAITMFAVFEHLSEHEKVLTEAHRLLAAGGLLITGHSTSMAFNFIANVMRLGNRTKPLPDLGGAFAAPWHTALFSVEATETIVARHGFELVEVGPVPQGRADGLYGWTQLALQAVNTVGWPLLRTRWPLMTTHVFVFRKLPA